MTTLTTYNKTGLRRIAELRAELLAISNASVLPEFVIDCHCDSLDTPVECDGGAQP